MKALHASSPLLQSRLRYYRVPSPPLPSEVSARLPSSSSSSSSSSLPGEGSHPSSSSSSSSSSTSSSSSSKLSSMPLSPSSLVSSSALSMAWAGRPAWAISYDEVFGGARLAPPSTPPPLPSLPELPAPLDIHLEGGITGVVSSAAEFLAANPIALAGGLIAAVGLPTLLFFSSSSSSSSVSASTSFRKLASARSHLLDIRPHPALSSPDLSAYRKRVIRLPFHADKKDAFLKKALARFKNPMATTVYILDRLDGESLAVAELLAKNGFKSVYAIKDGMEGPTGWQNSNLPLLQLRKFLFDVDTRKEVFDNPVNEEGSNLLPATLGVAAATGVIGLAVFSEVEPVLQLLGSAVLLQLFVKKLLFAKDREKTLKEIQVFVDTKVAAKQSAEEMKGVGKLFLLKYEDASEDDQAVIPSFIVREPTLSDDERKSLKVIASVDVKRNAVGIPTRPLLSLYAQYPELKPPSWPIPVRP